MKNPLSNGRIVQQNADYLKRQHKRGDAGYPMSRSTLMDFAKCPRKWRRSVHREDRTTSTDWGSLVDTLLFETEKFGERFAVKPETYLNKKNEEKPFNMNSDWCSEWVAAQGEKACIKKSDYDSALKCVGQLTSDPEISQLIKPAKFQVFIQSEYQDKETGLVIPIYCLPDVLPAHPNHKRKLIDLKTAQSADLATWPRVCHRYDYDAQAAIYLDAHNSIPGVDERDIFQHVIQESEEPFETATPILSDDFITCGRKKYLAALKLYCWCLTTNIWPGYNWIASGSGLQIDGSPVVEPDNFELAKVPVEDPIWIQ